MNNIGFGIFCFGDEKYFKGAEHKVQRILERGFHCYVLTNNPNYFRNYNDRVLHVIPHHRITKSYHDKMILPKHIIPHHDICILIDADSDIKNYDFIKDFKTYSFKKGISYIDTLLNHRTRKQYIKDLNLDSSDWNNYKEYVNSFYNDFGENELIWEHFLVINKEDFNVIGFYEVYEKLQIVKERIDINDIGTIMGAGEGISIQISAIMSSTPIQKDIELFDILKDKIKPINRYTPLEQLPEWFK